MSEQELKATVREMTGKANARRLRGKGIVPSTLYGVEDKTVSLSLIRKEVEKLLSGAHSVIKIVIDGQAEQCVIKEIQHHPVRVMLYILIYSV